MGFYHLGPLFGKEWNCMPSGASAFLRWHRGPNEQRLRSNPQSPGKEGMTHDHTGSERGAVASPTHQQQPRHKALLIQGAPVYLSLALFFCLGAALLLSSPHRTVRHVEHYADTEDGVAPLPRPSWCSFGTLSGYWADAPAGRRHWQVLDPACAMVDMLDILSKSADEAVQDSNSTQVSEAQTNANGEQDGQQLPALALPPRLSAVTQELDVLASKAAAAGTMRPNQHGAARMGAEVQPDPTDPTKTALQDTQQIVEPTPKASYFAIEAAAAAQTARIVFLSDSVDRFILTYLCDLIGGQVSLMNLDGTPHVEDDTPPPSDPAASTQQAPATAAAAVPEQDTPQATETRSEQDTPAATETRPVQDTPEATNTAPEQDTATATQTLPTQDAAGQAATAAQAAAGTQQAGVEGLDGLATANATGAVLATNATTAAELNTTSQPAATAAAATAADTTAATAAATATPVLRATNATRVRKAGKKTRQKQQKRKVTTLLPGSSNGTQAGKQATFGTDPVAAAAAAAESAGTAAAAAGDQAASVQPQAEQQQQRRIEVEAEAAAAATEDVDAAGELRHQITAATDPATNITESVVSDAVLGAASVVGAAVGSVLEAVGSAAEAVGQQVSGTASAAGALATALSGALAADAAADTASTTAAQQDGEGAAGADDQVQEAQPDAAVAVATEQEGDKADGEEEEQDGEGKDGEAKADGKDQGGLTTAGSEAAAATVWQARRRRLRAGLPASLSLASQAEAKRIQPGPGAVAAAAADGAGDSGAPAGAEAVGSGADVGERGSARALGPEDVVVPGVGVRRYLPNMCLNPKVPDVKLLGTYIPGVHPTGPYHRNVRKGWQQQIMDVEEVWQRGVGPDMAPDVVVLGACLWDLARLSAYEPELVSGRELPRAFLDSWVANFTLLVQHVRATLPQTTLLVFHTTMMPRFDPYTGMMEKAHLGRRFYISQMNAVGRMAASLMGLEVLDYAALANRFAEGQTYLADAIHPGPGVGLEVANILLNYVHQVRYKQLEDPDWHHPSMWKDRSQVMMRMRRKRRKQGETGNSLAAGAAGAAVVRPAA